MKKIILSLCVLGFLTACSKKNNSFKNRTYHKTTSWFNPLFNAEEQMDKLKDEHIKSYEYNWSDILPVDPITELKYQKKQTNNTPNPNPNQQSQKVETPTGLDAVEAKAAKAIEKHSMFIKGKEYNTMIGRAYLLMGKARYLKKEYFDALDALNFVKTQLPDSKYAEEAKMYLTLAELKGGNFYDGRDKLAEMYEEGLSKKKLQLEVAKSYGQFLIDNKDYEKAIEVLIQAEDLARNNDERARLNYILGQLSAKLKDKQAESEAYFTRAYELKPGFNMEVKSQVAIAENYKKGVNNYEDYKQHFLDLAKKGVYKSRANEFDYAIGKMALKDDNLPEAELYLKKSLSYKENVDSYIKGKAYEAFGDLEFERNNYLYATAYYDSAVSSITIEKEVKRINLRNDALKKLMEKHYLVQKNDSILKIAKMPKAEQETFFTSYITKLKEQEAKKQEEELKQLESQGVDFQLAGKQSGFSNSFSGGGNKFYFYNQGQKSDGKLEFQRIWGTKPLRDNWRSSEAAVSAIEQKELELTGQVEQGNPRRFELDFYLEKIPTQTKLLNDLKIERDTTELSLGIGYYDQFQNEKLAFATLEHLVSTPPKNPETKANALYQIYRIAKEEKNPRMEVYKNQILTEYPNSLYAGYINNPLEDYLTPETKEALRDYELAYDLYKDGKYADVKVSVKKAIEQYPTQTLIAKFALLNAYAVGKSESEESFKSALEITAIAYEGTDEAKVAKRLLEKINKSGIKETTEEIVNPKTDVNLPSKEDRNNNNRANTQVEQPKTNTNNQSVDSEDEWEY